MIRIPFILLFFFILGCIEGQNLVPNPGFEDYDALPDNPGQIDRAKHWTSTSRVFTFSNNPHGDYYHRESPNDMFRVPNPRIGIPNINVNLEPRSGDAYAGVYIYNSANLFPPTYIQTPLRQALETNQWYYIEFFVANRGGGPWYVYSDAIGAAFSDSLYIEEIDGYSALSLEPAIENVTGLIKDSLNWTRINGCYKAEGSESHLIVGNFKNYEDTYVIVGHPTGGPNSVYIFIDDVSVIPMKRKSTELILCEEEDFLELSATYWNADYYWNTGHTDSVLLVDEPGVYTVEVSLGDCFFTDTFVVHGMQALESWNHRDTTICDGALLKLESPVPGQINWSTGDTSRTIQVDQSGLYTLDIETRCGEFQLSKYVEVKDCKCQVYVPNAFSPNGDGINDLFEIFPYCDFDLRIVQMEFFNRWGEKVYSSTDPESHPWDGSYRGKTLDPGPYIWKLEYEYLEFSEWQQQLETGVVNLMK